MSTRKTITIEIYIPSELTLSELNKKLGIVKERLKKSLGDEIEVTMSINKLPTITPATTPTT